MNKKSVIFSGSSGFAKTILLGLLKSENYNVIAVLTQPDKAVGRKRTMQQTAVSAAAQEHAIKVLKPASLKTAQIEKELSEFKCDYFIVAAYGKIIPQNILNLPKLGALNVHGSLLPKYRGASPIQSAILNGDNETGISIMLMDAEMDHGPVLLQESLKIDPNDKYPELEQKLANLGQILLIKALNLYDNAKIKPVAQNHQKATFCKVLTKEDGMVDWSQSAEQIYNKFRALYQWPEIWTRFEGKTLKIKNCGIVHGLPAGSVKTPGKVFAIDKNIFVACGKGALQLFDVQLESKNAQQAKDFLNGHKNFINSVLG